MSDNFDIDSVNDYGLLRENSFVSSEDGSLADIVLSNFLFIHSEEELVSMISQERIFVNDVLVESKDLVISEGDVVLLTTRQSDEPVVDSSFEIIFEDDSILLVNKSGNLPVHASGKYHFNSLKSILERTYSNGLELHPAHRIDRETSGLVLFAKSKDVLVKIHESFSKSLVKKTYLAFCFGLPHPSKGTISAPLLKTDVGVFRNKVIISPEGKPAITNYTILSSSQDMAYSLISVDIIHGRSHQIRVHMASIKNPLVGDKLYGRHPEYFLLFSNSLNTYSSVEKSEILAKLGALRHLLHAHTIAFHHPVTSEYLSFSAPLPEDFVKFSERSGVILPFTLK